MSTPADLPDVEGYTPSGDNAHDDAAHMSIYDEQQKEVESTVSRGPPEPSQVRANLQVVGGFFLMFNSWGIANAFGSFQTYYSNNLLRNESDSNISWIGSIQTFLLLFVGGLLAGPIIDAGHCRTLMLTGAFLVVFGMMMLSLCKEYWQIILAQGLVVGAGMGCLLLPGLAVIPQYFKKRKGLTTGIALGGSGVGAIIYPVMFQKLLPEVGFPWTTRIMGFLALGTLVIPVLVIRPRSLPAQRRPLFDREIWKISTYVWLTIACFFALMGLYIPLYYAEEFAIQQLHIDTGVVFYLLPIINAGSTVGRILPSYFADVIGTINVAMPCVALSALLAFCWPAINSIAGLIVWSVIYGFFSGAYVSLASVLVVSVSPNMALLGTHMGMNFTVGALGILIGNPVAGAIVTRSWLGLQLFTGFINATSAILLVIARLSKTGFVLRAKA